MSNARRLNRSNKRKVQRMRRAESFYCSRLAGGWSDFDESHFTDQMMEDNSVLDIFVEDESSANNHRLLQEVESESCTKQEETGVAVSSAVATVGRDAYSPVAIELCSCEL